jgi:hypothetical protein
MKKNTSNEGPGKTEGKGSFYKAGEIIGSIGFHIVEGKNKAVGAVSDGFSILKKVIKKKSVKKRTAGSKPKKDSKKKTVGKTAGKATKRVKKPANKVNSAKAVRKKGSKVKKAAKSATEKDTDPVAK